jgi:hypothetical protein
MAMGGRIPGVRPHAPRTSIENGGPISVSGARPALAVAIAGLASVVLVGATPRSPMAVDLPHGVRPLGLFAWISRALHLSSLTPVAFSLVAQAAVLLAVAGFLLLLRECWRGNVALRTVVTTAIVFQGIAVAMPLILSHDVYSYALYGRIASVHHANPYLIPPSHFPGDSFYPFVSHEWRGVTSLYGPAFVHLAALLTKVIRSPGGLILAFKGLSGAASLAAMFVTIGVARRVAPRRAAFAGALIGINPLVIFDVVGGGHMDALVALFAALALWAVCTRKGWLLGHRWARELGATTFLTLGALIKPPFVVCLLVYVAVIVWSRRGSGAGAAALGHLALISGIVAVFSASYFTLRHPTLGLVSVGDYQNWVAGPVFLTVVVPFFLGIRSSTALSVGLWTDVVRYLFLLGLAGALVVVVRQLAQRSIEPTGEGVGAAWGWTLLLLLLTAPIVWPWYVVWLLPFVWLLPATPRIASLALSSVLCAWTVIGEWTVYGTPYRFLTLIGLMAVSPFLLYVLFRVGRDLIRRGGPGPAMSLEERAPPRRSEQLAVG